MRLVRKFFEVHPIGNNGRLVWSQVFERIEYSLCRSNPAVDATIQRMLAYRIEKVPRKDDLRARDTECGSRDDRIIPREMAVHDIESAVANRRPQPQCGNEVERIGERKADP